MNQRRVLRVICLFILAGAAALAAACSNCAGPTDGKKGLALAVGLNSVDPDHYDGWSGDLTGCEPDANDMKTIASSQGFDARTLLTAQATRGAVIDRLAAYAAELRSGDLLVVSYSGHGGQIPDMNGDEDDGLDETWCLYDGELLDDELHEAWAKFVPGVRILVFSDSCHSGTAIRMRGVDFERRDEAKLRELNADWSERRLLSSLNRPRILSFLRANKDMRRRLKIAARAPEDRPIAEEDVKETFAPRALPPGVKLNTYWQHKDFYDNIGRAAKREDESAVQAALILISGCQDDQISADLGFNGLFTMMLKQVWKNGDFAGDHRRFHEDIRTRVLEENGGQSPNFFLDGASDQAFIALRPYKLE